MIERELEDGKVIMKTHLKKQHEIEGIPFFLSFEISNLTSTKLQIESGGLTRNNLGRNDSYQVEILQPFQNNKPLKIRDAMSFGGMYEELKQKKFDFFILTT